MTQSAKSSPLRSRKQGAYSILMHEGYPRERHSRDDRKLRRQKARKGGRFNPDMTRRRRFGQWEDTRPIPS